MQLNLNEFLHLLNLFCDPERPLKYCDVNEDGVESEKDVDEGEMRVFMCKSDWTETPKNPARQTNEFTEKYDGGKIGIKEREE